MLSIEECRELMGRPDLTDEEIAQFLADLDVFLNHVLDDYLRDAFGTDEV